MIRVISHINNISTHLTEILDSYWSRAGRYIPVYPRDRHDFQPNHANHVGRSEHHKNYCIPIGPELDVIIQGLDNAPNQSLSPSDDDDGGGGCVLDQ